MLGRLALALALHGAQPQFPFGHEPIRVDEGQRVPRTGALFDDDLIIYDAQLHAWYRNEVKACVDLKVDALAKKENWTLAENAGALVLAVGVGFALAWSIGAHR